jgi:hypothetical protein
MTIELEPISISAAPEDAPARRQRERDELARQAVEDALARLQMPTDTAQRAIAEAGGPDATTPPPREPMRGPLPETPGSRPTGSWPHAGRVYPAGERPFAPDAPAPQRQSPTFAMPRVDTRMLSQPPEGEPLPRPRVAAPVAAAVPAPMGAPPSPAGEGAPQAGKGAKPAMAPPGRMDEGLPSQGDIDRERGLDVLRGIFGGIGNALLVGSGRAPMPMRSGADRLREEREQGLTRARAEKRQAIEDQDARRDAEAAQSLARERLTQQAAERAGSRDIQARGLAVQERGMELQGRRLDMQQATAEEERAAARAELARRAAEAGQRDDAASPLSQSYQQALRTRIATYRSTGNTQLADSLERLFPADRLSQMPASSLETVLGRTGGLPQVHTRGRAGGGGGGGGAARTADPAAELRRARAEADLADAREGEEILPGVRARLTDRGEAPRIREGFARAAGQAASLQRVGEIGRRYGGVSAAISREAQAALVPELTQLRGMVAEIGGTGVINPSEVPTINAALPNPAELQQMTFGTFDARLSQWRRSVEDRMRANLDSRGVSEAGIQRAIRALWQGGFSRLDSGAAASETQRSEGPLYVVSRNGRAGRPRPLTPEQREALGRQGFTVEEAP